MRTLALPNDLGNRQETAGLFSDIPNGTGILGYLGEISGNIKLTHYAISLPFEKQKIRVVAINNFRLRLRETAHRAISTLGVADEFGNFFWKFI